MNSHWWRRYDVVEFFWGEGRSVTSLLSSLIDQLQRIKGNSKVHGSSLFLRKRCWRISLIGMITLSGYWRWAPGLSLLYDGRFVRRKQKGWLLVDWCELQLFPQCDRAQWALHEVLSPLTWRQGRITLLGDSVSIIAPRDEPWKTTKHSVDSPVPHPFLLRLTLVFRTMEQEQVKPSKTLTFFVLFSLIHLATLRTSRSSYRLTRMSVFQEQALSNWMPLRQGRWVFSWI